MTDQPTCKTCRYWQERDPAVVDGIHCGGHCHIRSVDKWPYRGQQSWCGEHKPHKVGPITFVDTEGNDVDTTAYADKRRMEREARLGTEHSIPLATLHDRDRRLT